MFWSHRQNVGRNELRTSPPMATLGFWMLQISLQKRTAPYWRFEPNVYLFLSQSGNSSESTGIFMATFWIFIMSSLSRNLWAGIWKKRRKMSSGSGTSENVPVSPWQHDLRDRQNFAKNRHFHGYFDYFPTIFVILTEWMLIFHCFRIGVHETAFLIPLLEPVLKTVLPVFLDTILENLVTP